MNDMDKNSKKRINDIISIIKLVSLLLCTIIIYTEFSMNDSSSPNFNNNYFDLQVNGIVLLSIILVYLFWSFSSMKVIKFKNIKIIYLCENLIFLGIFSALIILSKTYVSQYELLFLFIINK